MLMWPFLLIFHISKHSHDLIWHSLMSYWISACLENCVERCRCWGIWSVTLALVQLHSPSFRVEQAREPAQSFSGRLCNRFLVSGFFFFIFKKKFQKYISVLKYFKNIPRSPSHRATGPMCNFFFQICNEVPGEKKRGGPVAPPTGDRGLSPTPRATGSCRPLGGRQAPLFFQGPILSYSSVYSSSSSARSRPLTPTARNLSFIKSREKIAWTSLISWALWNPQT